MAKIVKICLRGLLAPVLGYSLAKDWENAKLKSSGYEGSSTLESLTSRIELLTRPEELPHDERLTQVLNGVRECLGEIGESSLIRVLDIGGSFGEYFFRVKAHFPKRSFEWTVLETKGHCSIIPDFLMSTKNLQFISEFPSKNEHFNIALLSGVVHCVEHPYELVESACSMADSVIVNRLPLSSYSKDKVAIQRPGLLGSKGSYPVHILSETIFLKKLQQIAAIRMRWMVPQDSAVVRFKYIEMQGFLLKPRRNTSV